MQLSVFDLIATGSFRDFLNGYLSIHEPFLKDSRAEFTQGYCIVDKPSIRRN